MPYNMQASSYVRQPRKPSGKINQKLNQKEITFENHSEGGNGLHTEVMEGAIAEEDSLPLIEVDKSQASPRFNDRKKEDTQSENQQPDGSHEENHSFDIILPTDKSKHNI